MLTIVIRTLRQAGFGDHTVHTAVNGADALQQIEQEQPDLVLSDWTMPECGGLDLLKQVRVQGYSMPFGFVTAEENDAERRHLAAVEGASFFIAKPFTSDSFQQALGPLLAGAC